MSSIYLFQQARCSDKVWIKLFSNSTINIPDNNNETNTSITKKEMKELILLCRKGVHFTFDGKTYAQTNGVAMGSPLGPVLSGSPLMELTLSR